MRAVGALAAALGAALLALGCGSSADSPAGPTRSGVITTAGFARVTDDTARIADGLNLDGQDTETADPASCSQIDFTSPSGEKGIDNQFGSLLPLIESYVGTENIGQLLSTAIANGQLLIVMAIDDLDDPVNDDDVTVRVAAGLGRPLLDAQGKFITYQTFGVDPASPVSTIEHGRVTNGTLEFGPGFAVLPVRVLDANFNLAMHGVMGRIKLTPDAEHGGVRMKGIIAGGLAVADVKGIIAKLNIGQDLISTATTVVGITADLQRDEDRGVCLQLSAGLEFETTPAFLLDH
jgi:hypothetical protein